MPLAGALLLAIQFQRDRSGTGSSSRRRQACRGRRLPEGLTRASSTCGGGGRGVQPNMHHLLAHQNLADSMGLGHLLPRVRCVIEIPEHKKVNTMHDRLLRRRDC